jgi:hypothetical protein
MDRFIDKLKIEFDRGKEARVSPEYKKLEYQRQKALKKLDNIKANEYLKKMPKTIALMPNDPNFRRLYYVRYADD